MKYSTTGGRRATSVLAVAALLLGFLGLNPAPASAAESLIVNGKFDNVNPDTGLPAGWTTWAPAGTTTFAVEPTAGPLGDRALRISAEPANDVTARRAMVQSIAIDDTKARTVQLSGFIKGEGLATLNWTSVRVQGRDAAGNVTIPVAYHGRSEGTTRLMVEPMLDRSGGTVWFADLALTPVDNSAAGLLSAQTNPRGAAA